MFDIPKSDIAEIVENLGEENHQFEDARVLVYGWAGLLGSLTSSYFHYLNTEGVLRKPCKVIAVDNFTLGQTPNVPNDYFYKCFNQDILVPIDEKLRDEQIDYIINFTSIGSPKIYVKMPLTTLKIGGLGTENVLNFARICKPKSILLFSSSEIYGSPEPDKIPSRETYPASIEMDNPRICYDASKVILEAWAWIYHDLYKTPVKVIRPFNVVSSGMSLSDGRVFPSFVRACLDGQPIKVYGTGQDTRNFCYGTDFITGMIKVLLRGKDNGKYNLGNDACEISMLDLAYLISAEFGNSPIKLVNPDVGYAIQPRRRTPDLTKIKEELGYTPKVSLQETIKRYCTWAKTQKNI